MKYRDKETECPIQVRFTGGRCLVRYGESREDYHFTWDQFCDCFEPVAPSDPKPEGIKEEIEGWTEDLVRSISKAMIKKMLLGGEPDVKEPTAETVAWREKIQERLRQVFNRIVDQPTSDEVAEQLDRIEARLARLSEISMSKGQCEYFKT